MTKTLCALASFHVIPFCPAAQCHVWHVIVRGVQESSLSICGTSVDAGVRALPSHFGNLQSLFAVHRWHFGIRDLLNIQPSAWPHQRFLPKACRVCRRQTLASIRVKCTLTGPARSVSSGQSKHRETHAQKINHAGPSSARPHGVGSPNGPLILSRREPAPAPVHPYPTEPRPHTEPGPVPSPTWA